MTVKQKVIKEIPTEEYYTTFDLLSTHHWETMSERNSLKKRKKYCDYLLRKGWESEMVYEKVKELEKQLEDQRKLAEEMRRKAEQGSMQMQGEVQELLLEELLKTSFPFDQISEVGDRKSVV